jgi:beta-lactamase regulating signal transducer with metallopeptidase domain
MTTSTLLANAGRTLWFGNGFLVKGAIILLFAALSVRVLVRAPAAARHNLWLLGLAGVLLASLGAWLLPAWSEAPAAWLASPPLTSPAVGLSAPKMWAAGSSLADVSSADLSATLLVYLPHVLLGAWTLGVLALTIRVGLDLAAARRLALRAVPLEDVAAHALTADLARTLGMRTPPALRMSEAIDGPVTVGLRRLMLILPATYRDWSADELRGVLAHELAHAARHDCASQAFARLVCALHWPNPLVWWASRHLITEREMAADDAALRAGVIASDYAGFLLRLAAAAHTRPRGALSMTDGAALGERISRLLDPLRSHAPVSPRRAALAAVGVLVSALTFGCFGGVERPPSASAGLWLALAPYDSSVANQLLARADQHGQAGTRGIVPGAETYRTADGRMVTDRFLEGPADALAGFVDANVPASDRHLVLLEQQTNGNSRTRVVDLATRIDLDRPSFQVERDGVGRPLLVVRFHPADARHLAALTAAHPGERLALVTGANKLLTAPVISSPIGAAGKLTFGNDFSEAELRTLLDGLGDGTRDVSIPK